MYPYIERNGGSLYVESLSLHSLAKQYGTPLFVYSENAIRDQWSAYEAGFSGQDHLICFAVKANSNLAVLALLAKLGAGFDIVSVGELERVLKAGGDAGKVVFSGVGKRPDEIRRALEVGIRCFNIESEAELQRVNEVAAEIGIKAPSLCVSTLMLMRAHTPISRRGCARISLVSPSMRRCGSIKRRHCSLIWMSSVLIVISVHS